MIILTGTIVGIDLKKDNSYGKKVVQLKLDSKQIVFVEFRQVFVMKYLNEFNTGDNVHVAVEFNGKTSKTSGISFNNMIGKSIKKV